jgi:hypothetical protein
MLHMSILRASVCSGWDSYYLCWEVQETSISQTPARPTSFTLQNTLHGRMLGLEKLFALSLHTSDIFSAFM